MEKEGEPSNTEQKAQMPGTITKYAHLIGQRVGIKNPN